MGVKSKRLAAPPTGGDRVRAKPRPLAFPGVDPTSDDPIVGPIFSSLRARKAGPLNIHRTIAHAPVVYRGFVGLASALREAGATTRAERELAILRVLQIEGAEYETVQHKRIGLSVGLSEKQISGLARWRRSKAYTPREQLILELAEGVVRGKGFEPALSRRLKHEFTPQALVELAMTSAFYVAVSCFTSAILVAPETVATTYGEETPG